MNPDARDLINALVMLLLPLAVLAWLVVAALLGLSVATAMKEWARRRRERRLTGK